MAKRVTWNGVGYLSIANAARMNGVSQYAMQQRLAKGYTCDADMHKVEQARRQKLRDYQLSKRAS